MTKVFPWGQDYFIARVLLGFSEEEFWESTPRKVYMLKLYRDKYFGGKKRQKTNLEQAHEILAILGQKA